MLWHDKAVARQLAHRNAVAYEGTRARRRLVQSGLQPLHPSAQRDLPLIKPARRPLHLRRQISPLRSEIAQIEVSQRGRRFVTEQRSPAVWFGGTRVLRAQRPGC